MRVQTAGAIEKTELYCKHVPIEIHGETFHANLIVLGEQGIEVVLGMNWMEKYK